MILNHIREQHHELNNIQLDNEFQYKDSGNYEIYKTIMENTTLVETPFPIGIVGKGVGWHSINNRIIS